MENPTCPIGLGIKWLHVPAKAGYKVTIYFILSRSLSEAPFQKRLKRQTDYIVKSYYTFYHQLTPPKNTPNNSHLPPPTFRVLALAVGFFREG